MTDTATVTATSPLAKSIAAMAGEGSTIKEISKGRTDLYKMNPFNIVVEEGFNPRTFGSEAKKESIDSLAKSIAAVGVKRPLKVRMENSIPYLVDGERRLRAVMRAIDVYGAEIRTVKVELAERGMTKAEATLETILQNDGEPLTALEKATAFKRLRNFGWSDKEIADSVGMTAARIGQLIELTLLPTEVHVMVENDEISPTLAWEIARTFDFEEGATLEAINAAKVTAEANGKKKVTPKSVSGTRTSFKDTVLSAFKDVKAEAINEEDEDDVVLVMTRAQFDVIAPLLKIELAETE